MSSETSNRVQRITLIALVPSALVVALGFRWFWKSPSQVESAQLESLEKIIGGLKAELTAARVDVDLKSKSGEKLKQESSLLKAVVDLSSLTQFTTHPADDEFVQRADFEEAIGDAWRHLNLCSAGDDQQRSSNSSNATTLISDPRQALSLVAVIAPPRHGKSLFIDELQNSTPRNTFVITVNYNGSTPFSYSTERENLPLFLAARMIRSLMRSTAYLSSIIRKIVES